MRTGRAFDRLVNLTDAIVAVAMTVLVLSIVDIRASGAEQTVWQIIRDHTGQLMTFAFTFVVVGVMWQVHNRLFSTMRGFDGGLFWLNLLWLGGIVFLPWPSALFGEGIGSADAKWMSANSGLNGAGMLYWGTLTVISLSGSAIGLYARHHPELLEPTAPSNGMYPLRGYIFAGCFFAIGITSLFAPILATWLPVLVLIPVTIVLGRRSERQPEASAPPQE